MMTTTTQETSQAKADRSAAGDVVSASARRVAGVELEAAVARCVPVLDGCIAEASGRTARPAPVIVTRPVQPSVATAARAGAATPGRSRMVYQRPVNPKLKPAVEPVGPAAVAGAAAGGESDAIGKKGGAASVSLRATAAADAVTSESSSSASVAAKADRVIAPPIEAIAPAAVLPRFAGEPVRADLRWPPQARGTGEFWPPEARIEAGRMNGRFPVAYAWHLLAQREPWRWEFEGRTAELGAAQAIAQVLQAAMASPVTQGGLGQAGDPCALVIPDHLSMAAQQDLLDAAVSQGLDLSLLPRPMAAAMAWCDRHAHDLPADLNERDAIVGSLLVLHLGLDEWEVSIVDLVRHHHEGQARLIPQRRRHPLAPLPSYGTELMHRLAIRSLEMSYQQMSAARVWELMWCTPWLKAAIAMLGDGDVAFPSVVALARHARSAEFLKQQCRQATQRIFRAVEPVAGLLRQCLGKTPQFTDIRDWFAQRKLEAPAEGFLGAVITGPMANMPLDKETVGLHHLTKIWPRPVRVLIEGVTEPAGLLARSAGWHADFLARHRQGDQHAFPSYLERLPRVRIAATLQGSPAFVDLLDDADAPVPGGLPIRRPQPLTGFPIKPDTTRFKIAIDHEDWPTVRIAAARLPQVLSEPEPVELHATLRSSHGFPEIELRPVRDGLFGRHRVLIDLRQLKDTGKNPDDFLHSLAQP